MINVLLVDDNINQSKAVEKYFDSSSSIKVVSVNNKDNALSKLNSSIDAVVIDMLLPNMESIDIIAKLRELRKDCVLVVTSEYYSGEMMNDLSKYNPNYILKKPYSFNTLEKIILSLGSKFVVNTSNNIKSKITNVLHTLGMPSNIKGFQYIRDCVELMYTDNSYLTKVTKELYPTVANKYDTTWQRVERSIRHAIDVSWSRGDYELMEELFGNSVDYDRAKPTNSEFIATLADRLRLDE